jgi:hypothetical protein
MMDVGSMRTLAAFLAFSGATGFGGGTHFLVSPASGNSSLVKIG